MTNTVFYLATVASLLASLASGQAPDVSSLSSSSSSLSLSSSSSSSSSSTGAASSAQVTATAPSVLPSAPVVANPTATHPAVSDWQGEALITDPAQECAPYSYAPAKAIVPQFPPIWTIANILSNDTDAMELFSMLNGTLPIISTKGTSDGNFQNYTPTYPSSDPDCWWSYAQCVTPKLSGLQPDFFQCPEPNTFAYAFDDGPNCSHNVFYDYMKSQNQLATLFYIGSNVLNWPLEAIRGAEDGHQLCVHTWSHRYMTALNNSQAFAELYYTIKVIKAVTGLTPTCFRPPFGDIDDRIRMIARFLGLETILWKYDSNDWRVNNTVNGTVITPANIAANYQNLITAGLNGTFSTHGAIMLMHEINNFTMSEAITFYPQLKQAFPYIVPIASCMNRTQPYAETNVSFPNFAEYVNARGGANVPSSSNAYISGTYSDPLSFVGSALPTSIATIFGATPGASANDFDPGASTKKNGCAAATIGLAKFLPLVSVAIALAVGA